jgi:hypothetical protein
MPVSLERTLVFATLVHAGVFAIAGRATTPSAGAGVVEPMKLVWIEQTAEVDPAPSASAPSPQEANGSPPDTPAPTAGSHPERSSSPTPLAAASVLAVTEPAPSASGGWTLDVRPGRTASSSPSLADLGLDGKNHFLGGWRDAPPPPDPDRVARERSNRAAGEAMRAALHDGDVTRGLGGGGPVVTALEGAVLAGTAPFESRAVIVAIADAAGLVTRVDIESFSDDLASFRAIADDVLNRLRDKRLRVPADAHGIAVRLEVTSRLASASGGGSGLDPRHAAINFDLSDLGARATRLVHARILGEDLL